MTRNACTIIGSITVVLVAAGGMFFYSDFIGSNTVAPVVDAPLPVVPQEVAPASEPPAPSMVPPLDQTKERVTKKPFGIFIDPATSPVQPERFGGYHTGADFETFPEEAQTDVVVRAMCDGEVVTKRTATGYGGILVTNCVIDGQPMTVLYGHLRLSSIGARVGERVVAGEQIGLLGTGGTSETDGERKHLHLGIHVGPTINMLGYVSARANLSGWLDPCLYVCHGIKK